MTGYTTEEVARLLRLSPAQIRSYTRAGFLSPARAVRGELRFSFQDLVLLRAAKGLMAARIPAAKIRGSLRRLKQQLPRIFAAGIRAAIKPFAARSSTRS